MELFLKLPAIFFNEFSSSWQEHELYSKLKTFILITFSALITREQNIRLKNLSTDILDLLKQVSASIGLEYRIHCKSHHLTHYSDLIDRFGPCFLFSTFRYERKHQFSKNLARKVKNTRNLAYTLHTRHQIQRAFEDQKLNFEDFNFFPDSPERTTYFTSKELEETGVVLSQLSTTKLHPFRLNKRVIRRSISGRNEWLLVTSFHTDEENNLWCKGRVCNYFYNNSSTPECHPTNGLQRIRLQTLHKFTKLDQLKPTNDFLHFQDGKYWLLEWI